ncbi:hypothetical protein [Gloeothece verrucosa]|uniref:Uncharacterized protein n=1 Tax=Gloeothece verrucosa (strain PCC 7822) TaxID=497965 RepID=E0UL04_GLOV7|nr:hypothetical protein [Gloeothece verrucosa]ADN17634.1 conserved hypothetical protein [Gloeothece verrucosa PCC 7822]
MENTFFDSYFRDDEGNIVIAQKPNLPFLVALVTTLAKFLVPSGNIYLALDAVAFGAWFTWAWLELFNGVNYFRKTLGLAVLLFVVASRLQW